MFDFKIFTALRVATAAALLVTVGGGAIADNTKADYTAMSPEELAEYLIFDAKGFRLDQKTQEGGTVRDRQTQDPRSAE